MQQIINFLIRYKNALLFLFLLLISLVFTVQSHSYHRSKFINSANFLSGGVYESVGGVQDYFKLKTYNEQLLEENARLRERIQRAKTTVPSSEDSLSMLSNIYKDSISQFEFIPAKVINNSYAKVDNFLTIKGGRREGIQKDMGVITSKGIVGVIDKVSGKYSTVLSVLNTNFTTNAQLQDTDHYGQLQWDGRNPNLAQLIDMQQQAPVAVGDTIETSGRSAIFPKGIPIGTVQDFKLDQSKNFFLITVKLINDMTNLGHVYVIENNDLEEIKAIEAASINEQ
ncbi:rod shape-determining protein MreC [Dokdonia sinensis]|uniref:Cell shape-determining protein MreC n=1 Tax=Dokdonia sinensis TaxID=2479847 RepID=A0A3M0FWB8_9FLAO|nr:rod shape-determining protein MreC [Dokdonia sinensis]RMB56758.1 rod shape-determining protein MreC [Dokdonia sinensis]